MISLRVHLTILLAAILVGSCDQKDEVLLTEGEQHLAETYAELVFFSESLRMSSVPVDSVAYTERLDSVLLASGSTREEFEQEFRRVTSDTKKAAIFLELSQRKLQTLRGTSPKAPAMPR